MSDERTTPPTCIARIPIGARRYAPVISVDLFAQRAPTAVCLRVEPADADRSVPLMSRKRRITFEAAQLPALIAALAEAQRILAGAVQVNGSPATDALSSSSRMPPLTPRGSHR